MPRKYKLIISDLHLNTGQTPGHLNPYESFGADDKLSEFLRYYSTDFYEDEDVELIIDGDFYDFLQVKVEGGFPDQVTESIAVQKIKACMDGHPKVHKALQEFIRAPHKRITVIPGNHDWDLVFPKVQESFRERLAGSKTDTRVQFVCDREYYQFDGIQVHHGMQFEAMQYHNFREQFLTNDGSEPILNMPWGSIFVMKVITRLKEERPYVDKIRPFWAYLIRALVFDPIFAMKVLFLATIYFIKTRLLTFKHFRSRLRQTWLIMREAEAYPDLGHKVRHLFEQHPEVHTIVLGHTHIPQVRRYEGDRQYINTGCWTQTLSLEMESYGRESKPTYAFIEYGEEGTRPTVTLREWCGYHDIYKDILF
jgi:UDP-2,3-diacylglucosamine pyrophosphatase LpxH